MPIVACYIFLIFSFRRVFFLLRRTPSLPQAWQAALFARWAKEQHPPPPWPDVRSLSWDAQTLLAQPPWPHVSLISLSLPFVLFYLKLLHAALCTVTWWTYGYICCCCRFQRGFALIARFQHPAHNGTWYNRYKIKSSAKSAGVELHTVVDQTQQYSLSQTIDCELWCETMTLTLKSAEITDCSNGGV